MNDASKVKPKVKAPAKKTAAKKTAAKKTAAKKTAAKKTAATKVKTKATAPPVTPSPTDPTEKKPEDQSPPTPPTPPTPPKPSKPEKRKVWGKLAWGAAVVAVVVFLVFAANQRKDSSGSNGDKRPDKPNIFTGTEKESEGFVVSPGNYRYEIATDKWFTRVRVWPAEWEEVNQEGEVIPLDDPTGAKVSLRTFDPNVTNLVPIVQVPDQEISLGGLVNGHRYEIEKYQREIREVIPTVWEMFDERTTRMRETTAPPEFWTDLIPDLNDHETRLGELELGQTENTRRLDELGEKVDELGEKVDQSFSDISSQLDQLLTEMTGSGAPSQEWTVEKLRVLVDTLIDLGIDPRGYYSKLIPYMEEREIASEEVFPEGYLDKDPQETEVSLETRKQIEEMEENFKQDGFDVRDIEPDLAEALSGL